MKSDFILVFPDTFVYNSSNHDSQEDLDSYELFSIKGRTSIMEFYFLCRFLHHQWQDSCHEYP